VQTYFPLLQAVTLLQYRVEQQLRAEGRISYVQFQLEVDEDGRTAASCGLRALSVHPTKGCSFARFSH
jgi:hypothetical protein